MTTRAQVQAFLDEWKALEKRHGLQLGGWCCFSPSVLDADSTELYSEEYGFREENLREEDA